MTLGIIILKVHDANSRSLDLLVTVSLTSYSASLTFHV